MSIFKSLVTLASTPIRCLGEFGKAADATLEEKEDK
jgi:hypothetical protein